MIAAAVCSTNQTHWRSATSPSVSAREAVKNAATNALTKLHRIATITAPGASGPDGVVAVLAR
jgi:hypothetical protein